MPATGNAIGAAKVGRKGTVVDLAVSRSLLSVSHLGAVRFQRWFHETRYYYISRQHLRKQERERKTGKSRGGERCEKARERSRGCD